jgi:hypothetical protein
LSTVGLSDDPGAAGVRSATCLIVRNIGARERKRAAPKRTAFGRTSGEDAERLLANFEALQVVHRADRDRLLAKLQR